jgi:pimeloyl-ACP methyl ester carboxylesterase
MAMSETAGTSRTVTTSAGADGEVRSADGTPIAYTRWGSGDPLILVDGALCSRAFGPAPKLAPVLAQHFTVYAYDRRGRGGSGDTPPYAVAREIEDLAAVTGVAGGSAHVLGISSGAALALAAAGQVPGITKLALYEAPFIVDASHAPAPPGYEAQLREMIAAGRRGEAVKSFMRFVGTPGVVIAVMPFLPMWGKLTAVAPTLPNDIAIVAGHQTGSPLRPEDFAAVTMPTLVMDGGKSPAWMRNGMRSLAGLLPDARYLTLDGQTHIVKPRVLAPAVVEFLAG